MACGLGVVEDFLNFGLVGHWYQPSIKLKHAIRALAWEVRRRRHVGHVGNPELVRRRRGEVTIYQIGRWSRVFVTPYRGRPAVPMACANKPGIAHQASDPLAAMRLPLMAQLSMNARCAICLARTGVHCLDPLQQRSVSLCVCGRWAVQPRIEASLRHAEHAGHCSNRECGLVRAHEPEDPDGIVPVSRANQAPTFESI